MAAMRYLFSFGSAFVGSTRRALTVNLISSEASLATWTHHHRDISCRGARGAPRLFRGHRRGCGPSGRGERAERDRSLPAFLRAFSPESTVARPLYRAAT
jgi:hypothetical protein